MSNIVHFEPPKANLRNLARVTVHREIESMFMDMLADILTVKIKLEKLRDQYEPDSEDLADAIEECVLITGMIHGTSKHVLANIPK